MSPDDQFQASHTPFDLTKYESPYELNRIRILKDLIPTGHGKRAVDIGCGPGLFSRELSAKGWTTASIDTDGKNIERARDYVHETHLGDAVSVLSTLPENQYDLALSLEIIEHMPRARGKDLLVEIIRVLKPRGSLIISTPNRFSPEGLGGYYVGEKIRGSGKWDAWDPTHVHIYSSSEILQLVRATGFSVSKIIGYYYGGKLPLIGRWKLPLLESTTFPLNRLGFNTILECHKSG
jgi:2-polyprenyl-3-methyl-5-hydroxy-6-metoxy-1,4-benzoquinol methylase